MWGDGKGFVPDEVIPGAKVAILAQNPGADEEREGRPMVGKTGQMMDQQYLPLAGLQRGVNVSVHNVLKCRWQRSNALPPAKVLAAAVAHCTAAHLQFDPAVEVIVAQGAVAWRALGGPDPITDWRGFLLP